MRITKWFLALTCLALLVGGVQMGSAEAAKKKPAKSWPGKKKHPHKKHTPASGPAKSGGAAAAPAPDADEDGDESAQGDDEDQDTAKKPPAGEEAKAKPKKVASDSGDEEKEDGEKSEDEDGDSTVVRKKAKHVAEDEDEDGAAPLAFELMAGPRVVHRTFDFHDSLAERTNMTLPSAYQLPAGPAPFIQLGLYPAAFATRGLAANFGIVGGFEKLLATKTNGEATVGQQFEAGLRFRLPLGSAEVGLTGAYGQHTFRLSSANPGPAATGVVPNVDYKFVAIRADARLRVADVVDVGFNLGTRLVNKTGSLGESWFPNTKTNSIQAGLSFGYRLTPVIGVVAGVDFLRYGFDFNPVPTTNQLVAGGAVDQYISGFLALRVALSGG